MLMKKTVLLFAFVVFGLSSCMQRTCPTYTKMDKSNDVEIEKQEINANV
jgi:hypothetical protein